MPDWLISFPAFIERVHEHLFRNWYTVGLKVIFPPLFYGFHGWLATWMAVWCLFHPYQAKYFPGTNWQWPLTPGIFPKRRSKLAQAVAATVTETLLTPQDIKAKAEALVTEHNIYLSIDLFVDSVLKEFRDTTKLHRLASELAELSPTLLEHLVASIIDGLEKGSNTRVAAVTEKIFDQVVLSARITLDQANEIAARLLEAFLTPEKIRAGLVQLLSPQNINALDESILVHVSGPYKILARIIGVKRVCYEWRNYLENEPEEADRVINDLVKRFGIRDQIAIQIANFDMRSLPLQNIASLKKNVVQFVEAFMVSHRDDILESVRRIHGEAMGTVRAAVIGFNPQSIPQEWLQRVKQELATFAHGYLKEEMGALLEKAIPALGMYSLIATKIDLFTSEQIEAMVYRICEQELRWLKWVGGAIGVVLGVFQIVVNIMVD